MRDQARTHYERGLALYQAKDYAGAIRELEIGYAIDPRREFLFANAQARRLAGDCRGAVPLYQRFLAAAPPPVQVNATQIALGRCAQQLAAARAEPQAAPPPPPPPAPAPPPPWTHDRLGAALLGAGVIGLVVGAGFLAASYAARSDAPPYADYLRHRDLVESRWNVAMVGLLGGAALAGGGVLRYAWVRRQATLRVTVGLAPGGLLVRGSF